MATDFLRQKWKTIFLANDINRDGVITLKDADIFADRFILHHRMKSEPAIQLKTAFQGFWQSMFLYDRDVMSPDNYITLMAQEYKKNRSEFCERMHRILHNCINLFDVNGDGVLSREEFVVAMKCWGIDRLGKAFIHSFPEVNPGYIATYVFRDAWVAYFTNDERTKADKEMPVLFALGLIDSM